MKITITMTKAESTIIKNLAIKYAPIDSEIDMSSDRHIESMVGVFDAKDSYSTITADLKEEMVIDALKCGDEMYKTIDTAINFLKPLFTNFRGYFKKFIDKWTPSIETIAANNLKKEALETKKFIAAAIVSHDAWVETRKDVKKKKTVVSVYKVNDTPLNIAEITAGMENAKVMYAAVGKDGNVTISVDPVDFSAWTEMKLRSAKNDTVVDWVSMADHVFNDLYEKGQRLCIYMITCDGGKTRIERREAIDFFTNDLDEQEYRFLMMKNSSYELGGIDDAKKFFDDHKACW